MTETYSGYKKGELKHAIPPLSKSRLEELAVLHPELAAEVEKIIAAMKSKGGQVGKPLGAGGKK